MKKFFLMAVAAIAALSSCSSDDAVMKAETDVTEFIATIEDGITTRTSYDATNRKAVWEAGVDQISIGGAVYTAKSSGLTTTFAGSGATKGADDKYHTYYPANLFNGTTASFPATLPLEAERFNIPMYAESSTTKLSFKNLCGVLAITVPQSEMSSVKSIVVSSDKQMNGEISNITEGGVLTFASPSPNDAEKKVTLTAASAISTEGKTFYVPVPANTHNPLLITISDGTETKSMITKIAGGADVARSTIYLIDFNENTNVWEYALQLGKTTATSIVIETDLATIPTEEDATHKMLNDTGILWEVLDGTTLRIQTSAPEIIGHGSFGDVGLFQGYSNVTSITGLEKVNFSLVTDMRSMFSGCQKLTSSGLDLSSLNTSNVENMYRMFFGCQQLTNLDLSNFNTSKVKDMNGMFLNCTNLSNLVLSSNFITSEVTTMYGMFGGCQKLTSLDLSTFDTSNVTNMDRMFYGCYILNTLNLPASFNTSKVTIMYAMFYNCYALTSLDLSSFNTSEVTNMNTMFSDCRVLSSLKLSDNFTMTKVIDKEGMFQRCGMSAAGGKCTISGVTSSDVKNALSTTDATGNPFWDNMQFAP